MPYKIYYNEEQDYIVVTVDGEFALSNLKELAADVARFIEQYDCNRILNDLRRASLTQDSFNIYNMPKTASQAGIEPRYRRALVVSGHTSDFRFLETVFLNQGHNVKMFTDINAAMRLLLYKETH